MFLKEITFEIQTVLGVCAAISVLDWFRLNSLTIQHHVDSPVWWTIIQWWYSWWQNYYMSICVSVGYFSRFQTSLLHISKLVMTMQCTHAFFFLLQYHKMLENLFSINVDSFIHVVYHTHTHTVLLSILYSDALRYLHSTSVCISHIAHLNCFMLSLFRYIFKLFHILKFLNLSSAIL